MKVEWTPLAKKQWKATGRYILKMYGKQTKDAFMQEVYQTGQLLSNQPYLGKTEPYLADHPLEYRSIVVNRLNKIVYRIDGETIRIVAFWDTRREPKNQAEQVK